jgi:Tfp pilus assembly protein PilN
MLTSLIRHEAIAVNFGKYAVHWVHLRRTHGGVRTLRVDEEQVSDEGAVPAALSSLVARAGAEGRCVVTSLDPFHARFLTLRAPEFDEPEELASWLTEQAKRQLLDGLPHSEFVFRTMKLAGDAPSHLVACARLDAIEARSRLIEEAGLVPSAIMLPASITGNAFLLDPEFTEGSSWVLWCQDSPVLARYETGRIADVSELSRIPHSAAELDIEIRTMSSEHSNAGVVRFIGGCSDLEGDYRREASADFTGGPQSDPGMAVALTQLFGGLGRIDFLDETRRLAATQAEDRRHVVELALPVLAVLVVVFLGLFGTQLWVDRALAEAQAVEEHYAVLLDQLRNEEATIRQMEVRLHASRHELGRRSGAAGILERAGGAVPDGLWLTALELVRSGEAGRDESWTVVAAGFSENQSAINQFVRQYEAEPGFTSVRLRHARQMTAEEVRRQEGAWLRFEMSMSARPDLLRRQEGVNEPGAAD